MTRKQDLADLIEQVEAGKDGTEIDGALVMRVLGVDQVVLFSYALGDDFRALGAAKALHEAVLPEWDWVIGRTNGGLTIHANVGGQAEAFEDCHARAWLLAILRALHAMEAGE